VCFHHLSFSVVPLFIFIVSSCCFSIEYVISFYSFVMNQSFPLLYRCVFSFLFTATFFVQGLVT
jgi:hypothetical protein